MRCPCCAGLGENNTRATDRGKRRQARGDMGSHEDTAGTTTVVVGFAFMAKKMESMSEVRLCDPRRVRFD